MRIAYVCSRYPAISHTFVLREIRALRTDGVEIAPFTIRRVPDEELLSAVDREEAAATTSVLPASGTTLIAAHARLILQGPRRYVRALRRAVSGAAPGARAHVWRLFHFAEAGLVATECARRGITHLHAHFANVGADVSMIASWLGGESWTWSFTMHGSTEFFDVGAHGLADKVADAAFVACISDFCASQMMKSSEPVDWHKLRVVRCGTDVAEFAPADRERKEGEPLRLLFVGRVVPAKGLDGLLEAMASLEAEGTAVELDVVGDGPDLEAARQRARALDVSRSVRFHGAVGIDRVREHFARADVFCLPSFAEGIPIVLMEAMAMELPVVASSIMGIPELVTDGREGLLVRPARPDQLAAAIAQLASDPALRRRMGEAGRSRIAAEYDVRTNARRLSALFDEVEVAV